MSDEPDDDQKEPIVTHIVPAFRTWPELPAEVRMGEEPKYVIIDDYVTAYLERTMPGHMIELANCRVKRELARRALKDSLVAQHGSWDAAVAPNHMERAVDDAVMPFVPADKRNCTGSFVHKEHARWVWFDSQTIPDEALKAAMNALPLPETISEAKAEYDSWEYRNTELEALYDDEHGDCQLSLGCGLRHEIVRFMMRHELRAISVLDVLARVQCIKEYDQDDLLDEKEFAAVLADLEYLASVEQAGLKRGGKKSEVCMKIDPPPLVAKLRAAWRRSE